VQMYKKSKPRAQSNTASLVNKRFDPYAFKIAHSLRHRINYNKI
jgi:hypothetical protein